MEIKQCVYVYRNMLTNKIEHVMIRDEDCDVDEERTWFFFEGYLGETPDDVKSFIVFNNIKLVR